MSMRESLIRARYRLIPDHIVGELLQKSWMDSLIPFTTVAIMVVAFLIMNPNMLSAYALGDFGRQFAELGLIVLASAIVLISGGIDLSVGATYALTMILGMYMLSTLGIPPEIGLFLTPIIGAFCGAINGFLVGYLRLRAFLTTLVTLTLFRSVYEILQPKLSGSIMANMPVSTFWDAIGLEGLWGVPYSLIIVLIVFAGWHVTLSRMRPGWRLAAVGGARRAAYNAGIDVRRTIFGAYVWSGALCGLAAYLHAARVGSAGSLEGAGLELFAITAAIFGGNSLGGGRGSVGKVIIGTIFVLILKNGMLSMSIPSQAISFALGLSLVLALFIDGKWRKHKANLINNVYVAPSYFELPKAPSVEPDSGSPYALNNKLDNVGVIGLGVVEAPEDVILDRNDNLYCGTRQGDIVRFFPPDYKRHEVFAHIGGSPLGMAFDRSGDLHVCVAGMGLYKVSPDKVVSKVCDETNRDYRSIIDDSRIVLADDLDIAPDGRIFFSEATLRFELARAMSDVLEARGSGRIICYDPKTKKGRTVLRNLKFPNGICMHQSDNESFYFAETWAGRVSRYYYEGPKKGTVELILEGLPGYPDNINRSSDGHYWLALVGVRSPVLDLALRRPAFRRRMMRRLPEADHLSLNLNAGNILKFTEDGTVLESLWDSTGKHHATLTSMREHKGVLYLGGNYNNRIGTYKIPDADPEWCALDSYKWT